MERGIIVPQGRRKLELHLAALLAGEEVPLSARTRALIEDMRAEWRELDRRIAAFDDEFAVRARTDEMVRLLTTIPGIGVVNATALVAAIGNARTFGPRPRPGSLAGARATADDYRRQATAARDHQARQRLLAQNADPRRPRGPAVACEERDAAGRVASRPARAGAHEHGRGGARQQAGTDRLGGAAERPRASTMRATTAS